MHHASLQSIATTPLAHMIPPLYNLTVYIPQLHAHIQAQVQLAQRKMNQQPITNYASTAASLDELLSLINNRPGVDIDQRFLKLRKVPFSNEEYQLAVNRAVNLYFKWLAEDQLSLWRLLGTNVTRQALEVLGTTNDTLYEIAGMQAAVGGPPVLDFMHRLVKARSNTRWAVTKLEKDVRRG